MNGLQSVTISLGKRIRCLPTCPQEPVVERSRDSSPGLWPPPLRPPPPPPPPLWRRRRRCRGSSTTASPAIVQPPGSGLDTPHLEGLRHCRPASAERAGLCRARIRDATDGVGRRGSAIQCGGIAAETAGSVNNRPRSHPRPFDAAPARQSPPSHRPEAGWGHLGKVQGDVRQLPPDAVPQGESFRCGATVVERR